MPNAIEIKNLNVSYKSDAVLKNITLNVEDKEYLGIMGPNGSGKSTLLKSILGIVPIDSGEIKIYGKAIPAKNTIVGYVPQFSKMDKSFPITVREVILTANLKKGLHPFFRFTNEHKEKADEILKTVDLEGFGDRHISQLSGGEFQRMLIARAMAANPKILLLDEPTASVDPKSRETIYNLLAELNKSMTIVLVTHDMAAISTSVKKLACLNETLVYHGNPELTEPIVKNLYGCPVDLIAHGLPHRVLKNHDGGDCCC